MRTKRVMRRVKSAYDGGKNGDALSLIVSFVSYDSLISIIFFYSSCQNIHTHTHINATSHIPCTHKQDINCATALSLNAFFFHSALSLLQSLFWEASPDSQSKILRVNAP